MRVAFLNRAPSAYPGGDLLTIADTIAALGRQGIEATYVHGEWGPADLQPFDLIQVKHCNFGWSWFNFTQTWASGKPYVVQPTFYPTVKLGMNARQIREALERAECVMPYSNRERDEIRTITDPNMKWVELVPNGTSETFHAAPTDNRRGVLCVSARKGDKNTDLVAEICGSLNLPFRLATDIDYSEMPAIYRAARVFVNASGSERMSRTTAEALCAGCRVLDTVGNRGSMWYPGIVGINPDDEDDLATAIKWAYEAEVWDYDPNAAAWKLTWDSVARQLKQVYEEV